MKDTAIAVIPARGGSKRVPRKNIKSMGGRPLIGYTIDAARLSGLFAMVVVTTDCPEVAEVAVKEGAEVPFLREPTLADDNTPVSAATVDMLVRLDPDGTRFDQVCQLMPNCPLRDTRDVLTSHRQFVATGAAAQISVMRFGWQNPWWAMRRGIDFRLDPLFPEAMNSRSQDLPELFCPTGAIWWAGSEALRREGTFQLSGRTGWEIGWQQGMDIDTQDDWEMAEMLMALASSRAAAGLEEQ